MLFCRNVGFGEKVIKINGSTQPLEIPFGGAKQFVEAKDGIIVDKITILSRFAPLDLVSYIASQKVFKINKMCFECLELWRSPCVILSKCLVKFWISCHDNLVDGVQSGLNM